MSSDQIAKIVQAWPDGPADLVDELLADDPAPAHGDKPPIAREVVGHAVGFTIGLANDRQVTFQTGFAEDEDDATVNARFDRIMRLADRQKAKYELVELRAELETHEKALARLDEDIARVDNDFDRSQAQLDVEIGEYQRLLTEARDKAYQNQIASGRSGKQPLSGHVKSQIAAYERAIEDGAKSKEKNVAEREQHRGTVIAQRARYEEEIASRLAKIAEKEALLG
jgi:hypothetical protein